MEEKDLKEQKEKAQEDKTPDGTGRKNGEKLVLSNAPHIRSSQNITVIMWLVVAALLPALVYSVYIFGLKVLITTSASIASAVIFEALYRLLIKKSSTFTDGSAVITGLLVAMNVPPDAPVWMVAIGSGFAIVIVKQLFGGLGFNIFNPALAARAFMLASWPVEMTTTWHQFAPKTVFAQGFTRIDCLPQQAFDAISQATPLAALKGGPALFKTMDPQQIQCFYDTLFAADPLKSLFIGNVGGCIGETSVLFLLAGGLFLLFRKIITWHIPVSFIGTVALFMFTYHWATGFQSPEKITLYHVLSGGLFLGAFFMATDMVTSPVSARGMLVFGCGCGIITSVIRLWGGYPEGVSYAILLMNATVPLIDRFTKPRVFGTRRGKK